MESKESEIPEVVETSEKPNSISPTSQSKETFVEFFSSLRTFFLESDAICLCCMPIKRSKTTEQEEPSPKKTPIPEPVPVSEEVPVEDKPTISAPSSPELGNCCVPPIKSRRTSIKSRSSRKSVPALEEQKIPVEESLPEVKQPEGSNASPEPSFCNCCLPLPRKSSVIQRSIGTGSEPKGKDSVVEQTEQTMSSISLEQAEPSPVTEKSKTNVLESEKSSPPMTRPPSSQRGDSFIGCFSCLGRPKVQAKPRPSSGSTNSRRTVASDVPVAPQSPPSRVSSIGMVEPKKAEPKPPQKIIEQPQVTKKVEPVQQPFVTKADEDRVSNISEPFSRSPSTPISVQTACFPCFVKWKPSMSRQPTPEISSPVKPGK